MDDIADLQTEIRHSYFNMSPRSEIVANGKRVVIVGGGFGGLSVARSLRKSGFSILLIDRDNYHLFQPLLYQVATSAVEPTAIAFPLRRVLRRYRRVSFLKAEVTKISTANSCITTSAGDVSYDYLVVAAGARTNYFGIPGLESTTMPLKTIGDALGLRNRIYETLEQAVQTTQQKEKERLLHFVIVGGGATGVEMAGALAGLRRHTFAKDFPELNTAKIRITLLNASPRLLEAFSPKSSERTVSDLRRMGVEVILDATVVSYDGLTLCYNESSQIECRTVIWASGITANRIEGLGTTGRGARVVTDDFCRMIDSDGCLSNVFVVGDQAIMCGGEQNTAGHPQVAQVAIQQGRLVGRNIIRAEKGEALEPFRYHDKGSMATIGRNRAVAELGRMRVAGFFAWAMWLFVHLWFIIGFKNRFTVMWDWAWNYFTHDEPLGSIIEANKKNNLTKKQ